ncbi:hypothetical protein N4R57_13170 [Rhodobacteraceae bacterium D3-12]|nr:hypothetical protein N4R57_13170 [Rhodobacteraceae bacterium D3-12]
MKSKLIIGAAMAALWAVPAAADRPVYGYAGAPNYCPAGMQPIVAGGVICCGVPNQKMSYQQANAHPVRRVTKRVKRVASTVCPEGMKGCGGQ